jgi:hypothetical protein
MPDIIYSVRPNIFVSERSYSLEPDALVWRDEHRGGRLAYVDIRHIRTDSHVNPMGPPLRRCILQPRSGRKLVLQATHYVALGKIEDRSASYGPFVEGLLRRIAAANPQAYFVTGLSWPMWLTWLVILIGCVAVLALAVVALLRWDFPVAALAAIAVIGMNLPAVWSAVRHGRQRRYRPEQSTS